MPERIWTYPCCGQTSTAISCPTCGGPGEFDGWGPTVADAMERYRSAYGLEPVGPHLQLAKEVFQGLRTECGRCDGRCFEGDVYQWRHCPECEGGGGVWTGSEDDIRAAWHRVIHFHPSAAVSRKDSPWFGVPWEPTPPASRLSPGRAGSASGAPAAIRPGAAKRARRTEPLPGSCGTPVNLKTDSKRRRLDALRERRRAARHHPRVSPHQHPALSLGHHRGGGPDPGGHTMDTGGPGVLS
jgi:hypothetical protein